MTNAVKKRIEWIDIAKGDWHHTSQLWTSTQRRRAKRLAACPRFAHCRDLPIPHAAFLLAWRYDVQHEGRIPSIPRAED